MLVLYTRYYFLNPMMISYNQMGNSILSCFGTMIYIFLKLVIKNLQLHYPILFHRVTHLSQHHSIYEKSISRFLHCREPTSTFQPRKSSIFLKNISKPKYIHKSFVHCLHVREVSVPVPVTAICVISSPFLISANRSKPVLVNASTVSAISDVIMQSVNVTSVPVCRPVSKNQLRHFFTYIQACYVAQLMYVNCVYIVMFVTLILPLVSQ